MAFDWTKQVIAELRLLWTEGHSTAEIGRRLGVSKNAVVGKAGRLNLDERPSPIRGHPWTDDAIKKLIELKSLGLSERIIGEKIGVSQYAIAAKVRSLDIKKRQAPSHLQTFKSSETISPLKAFRPAATPKPEPKPVKTVAPAHKITTIFRAPVPSTYKTCQFPSGTPRQADFKFCGKPTVPGKPYCQECCGIAYKPLHDRDQDAAD